MFNALTSDKVLPNQPVTPTRAASAVKESRPPNSSPTPPPAAGFNAKPNKDANAGQVPSMMGDKQKVAKPPAPQIGAAAPTGRAQDQRSGVETSMGAMADKLHPVKRR